MGPRAELRDVGALLVGRDEPTGTFGEHDALWGSFSDGFFFFSPYNTLVTGPEVSVLISLVKFHAAATSSCCCFYRVHFQFGIPPL